MPKIKSTHGMSVAEGAFWFFAVLMTFGFAYPVYRMRKRKLDRTTVTRLP